MTKKMCADSTFNCESANNFTVSLHLLRNTFYALNGRMSIFRFTVSFLCHNEIGNQNK